MRVTALAVAAALTLAVATGCAGTKPQHQDGAAAPAGTPSVSASAATETPAAQNTPTQSATATATNTQANTNTTPQKCRTGQLTAGLEEYTPEGKAGSTQDARIRFTNTGERCTLSGFVKLQLFAGTQPRETKVVESNGPPKTVTLDRGQSAWTQIAWSFLPADDERVEPNCSPRTTSIAVTPPGQTESVRVTVANRAICQHGEVYANPVSATRPA